MPFFSQPKVLIANGTSLSALVYIGSGRLASLLMPAAWTAAVLTFQGSYDGVTFANIFNDAGTEFSITVAANEMVQLESVTNLAGFVCLKVRSGTAGTPVNQGADRTITLGIRKFVTATQT